MNRLDVMRLGQVFSIAVCRSFDFAQDSFELKSLIFDYGPISYSYYPDTLALCDMDVLQTGAKRRAGCLKKLHEQYRKYMSKTLMFFSKLTKLLAGGNSIY
jgi:hypothetical protein